MSLFGGLFGASPQSMSRPDHPDLERLVQVVWAHDIPVDEAPTSDDKEVAWVAIVGKYIDVNSVIYMASQRYLRAFGRPSTMQEAERAATCVALWVDAFSAGVHFEREGGHRDAGDA
jgi:hypothetical protein